MFLFRLVLWASGWRHLRLAIGLVLGAIALAAVSKIGGADTRAVVVDRRASTVVRAVDGDTLLVRTPGGTPRRIRVLGIDTPETVKPDTPVQRCGLEASAAAKRWVRTHPRVRLVRDRATPNLDTYQRPLRYVRPADRGLDLSRVQVRAGLARVYTLGQNLHETKQLLADQTAAKHAHRGLWGNHCR